jgi:hypothetical protein
MTEVIEIDVDPKAGMGQAKVTAKLDQGGSVTIRFQADQDPSETVGDQEARLKALAKDVLSQTVNSWG